MVVSSRLDIYEKFLPTEVHQKLLRMQTRLADLVITSHAAAEAELESHNDSRQRLWGDKAEIVRIYRGSADEIFKTLLGHLASDYSTKTVTSFSIEEVPTPTVDEIGWVVDPSPFAQHTTR